jgi:hypothetical protein|tara:strand:- start:230 stop:409 length:180 start_codon:yes stop_codon:yes gene_type:complete
MPDKSELKVGDWVHVVMIGFAREFAYQIESIEGDEYNVVQKEGTYEHRVKVKKEKLRKL